MRIYREYCPDQEFLLPPSLRDWLPEGHTALLVSDLADELDLSEFHAAYENRHGKGRPPYHPVMMVKLLLYAYSIGEISSRKIEEATYTDIAFRLLAANQHPDHDSIAEFRKRHRGAFSNLFKQVLLICKEAGLVKLGHVSVDGTKVKANASKHKAMSYERMCQTEKKLEKQIQELLKKAEDADAQEDQEHGKGKSGIDIPAELARRESRLGVIRGAKAALEEEAREKARDKAKEAQAKIEERERKEQETGKKVGGSKPKVPDPEQAVPDPKAQRNFTDPESRIMKDGASKSFEQAYNAQAVVDAHSQIIVAASVTQEANDKRQMVPMLQQVERNTGRKPKTATLDNGYFSEEALKDASLEGIDLYVAVGREKRQEEVEAAEGTVEVAEEATPGTAEVEGASPKPATLKEKMKEKLQSAEGKVIYALRKTIVEPVFGQIKGARGLRRFSLRGIESVGWEWDLICTTHNILKLFRSGQWKKA